MHCHLLLGPQSAGIAMARSICNAQECDHAPHQFYIKWLPVTLDMLLKLHTEIILNLFPNCKSGKIREMSPEHNRTLSSWTHSSWGRLHKAKPVSIPAWKWGDSWTPIPSWGTIDSWQPLGEGESPTLQWITPHPGRHELQIVNSGSLKIKNKTKHELRRWGGGGRSGGVGGRRGVNGIKVLCVMCDCLKERIFIF